MIRVLLTSIVIFLYLLSSPVFAKSYGSTVCKKHPEQFYCYTVKKGETWDKLFSDPEQKAMVMKLNRMNIRIHSGMVIAIPNDIHTTSLLDVAPFKKQIDPPGRKVILVSLSDLAWGAYESDGTLVNWGPVSGGRGYCPDVNRGCRTSPGKFAIYTKQGAGCKSTRYPIGRGGAPMPYCMFFNGNYALHGSYEVPGYHASHGCVRLFINDAKWLNQEFVGNERVAVIVKQQL